MLIKFSYHRLKFISFAYTLCSMLMITKFQEENQKHLYIEISGLLNQRKSEIQKIYVMIFVFKVCIQIRFGYLLITIIYKYIKSQT